MSVAPWPWPQYVVRPHKMVSFVQAVELAHRLAAGSGIRRKVCRHPGDGSWLVLEAGA